MYGERSTKRPKTGPCRDKDENRRTEYKRRADELKNELRNQRMAMRKNGRKGFVTGPKASSTMVSNDGYCLKPCTKPKPTMLRSSQSRSKSRPRRLDYDTSESERIPKPKTKRKPVSTILEECEPSMTPKRGTSHKSSAPSTSSRMFSAKRPQKTPKKAPVDDVLRSEREYRYLDDDCLPPRDEYKQPDKSLRRLEELVGKIEKTERRIKNIQSRAPRQTERNECPEDPIKPVKKKLNVCEEKETVRTPLENSDVPDDVVIKTAENLLHRMVRPFVSDVVHRMFKTCLEWAICKHPTDDPSRMNQIVKALLHFQDDVERYNATAKTPERIVIKPGEIDPESITVINVKGQKVKKKRSDYTLVENQEVDDCASSPSESLFSDINTSLSDSDLAWLNCLEESELDVDFDRKENEFFFPETRLVNAVPNRQNPNVAELDMENVFVIRNPERYMEPDYSK